MSFAPSTEPGNPRPPSSVFASSTFRRALLSMAWVWLLPTLAVVVLFVHSPTQQAQVNAQDIEDTAMELLWEVADEWRLQIFELDEDIEWPRATTQDEDPWTVYSRLLRQRFFEASSDRQRLALASRLWALQLLDEHELQAAGMDFARLEELPRDLITDALYDELPESLHHRLDLIVDDFEERDGSKETADEDEDEDEGEDEGEDDGPAFPWLGQLDAERLRPLLREHNDTPPRDICFQLLTESGAWLGGNVVGHNPPHEARPGLFKIIAGLPGAPEGLFSEHRVSTDNLTCWTHELVLADRSRFYVGRHLESPSRGAIPGLAIGLCFASLVWLVIGSYRLASRTVGFVEDLHRARSHLEGNTFPRLRRRGDDGDFDRATMEINTILDRLDSALGSLTHVTDNIAHDLRTPLTRLQGQLDLLRRSKQPSEAMILAVQEETDQLIATFNALLRIAQVQSGSRRQGFRPFDLCQVVADVSDLYAPAFSEQGLVFQCITPAQPVPQHGDSDLWMQALSNLIDNALKYTQAGGQVHLTLRGGRKPHIVLRDNGSGIPEGELEKVFERFYRSDRYQKQRGAGLGLSLVAAVCELHRAEIRLANDSGLVVTIQLPGSRG